MNRLPMLAGSRVALVMGEAEVLRPPAPLDPIADVDAAVREAVRYPLSGPPLEQLVTRAGRATVVVDPRVLPLPGAPLDPRQEALAAVLEELSRLGMRTTILSAGGLERRAGDDELELLLRPSHARAFRGVVAVHDCESAALRPLGETRLAPELADADLVVVVSAAETLLHGGPASLLGACGAETARAVHAESLLETSTAPGWRLALGLEGRLASRCAVFGVSLVLDHPRLAGRFRDYPHEPDAAERLGRSSLRRLFNALPAVVRRRALQGLGRELNAAAALAGPPSVAHVEALLRGIALRGTTLERPLDALVVPIPWKSPHRPRAPLNPITATATALGLALRLWRDRFPIVPGGTAVLLHDFARDFGHGPQAASRQVFDALRDGGSPELLAEAEHRAAGDARAIAAYRDGRGPHPLLPFADWDACRPALARLGTVIVAGCRDAAAARALGFVPSHSTAQAVEMARGLAGPNGRLGLLLAPPYPPLLVGAA